MSKRIIYLLIAVLIISGCRGWRSENPPIHPNINFDFQPKFKAQSEPLPIPDQTSQYNPNLKSSDLNKYDISEVFIKDGQRNYNIYCAACHTKTGNGLKSIITQKGWVVSNILEDVTINKSDQELFNIIKYGIRSMPGYGKKINNEEIWQIVLYVRALQTIENNTENEKNKD